MTSELPRRLQSACLELVLVKTTDPATPDRPEGYSTWAFSGPGCEILFVGKGPKTDRAEAFRDLVADPQVRLSWPQQSHSTIVLEAKEEGLCGNADALRTDLPGMALSVVTADCVPIVIAGPNHLATIHAGWRGLAGKLLQTTLESLPEDPDRMRAWIGPAIGACCYEVGPEVASQVVAASGPEVEISRQPRPHLDLAAAAALQLARAGVTKLHTVRACTRCTPDSLWSYRRDGPAAGRNWTFAWKK